MANRCPPVATTPVSACITAAAHLCLRTMPPEAVACATRCRRPDIAYCRPRCAAATILSHSIMISGLDHPIQGGGSVDNVGNDHRRLH
ncbi:hypothetical protein ACLOJK_019256 [Asimina triloba]